MPLIFPQTYGKKTENPYKMIQIKKNAYEIHEIINIHQQITKITWKIWA